MTEEVSKDPASPRPSEGLSHKSENTPPQEVPPSPKQAAMKAIQETQHVNSKKIVLTEDTFGTLFDSNGYPRAVKRFTWKNHNNIEVQVITYGARITSMKLPDKKGELADIVMGFDDLAGYIYYDNHFFGATIGRMTNYVENSTFVINGKQYWLNQNEAPHHANGGNKGLDKVIWNHYIDGTKVVLTYMSCDKEEGYPGDLLIRLTCELSPKNEFSIDMTATSSKPTIINLSNMNYINMAGHNTGPDELYKHMLTINANCYTIMDERGFPKGDIQNVNYTRYDFQIPKILTNVLGENDEDGYDQNLCINRGLDQENAFVARFLHVPSGRLLELYSNQCGVNFYTADRLGSGLVDIPVTPSGQPIVDKVESPFDLVNRLHEKIKDTLEIDKDNKYSELRSLIRKLQAAKPATNDQMEEEAKDEGQGEGEDKSSVKLLDLKLSPFQLRYLDQMRDITDKVESITDFSEIRDIINRILKATTEFDGEMEGVEAFLEGTTNSLEKLVIQPHSNLSVHSKQEKGSLKAGSKTGSKASVHSKTSGVVEENVISSVKSVELEDKKKKELEKELKRKGMIIPENNIPTHYKDGRIHGKGGCIYKKHGAICLQTQNYPNAVYHKGFPNCILNPDETYRHTIVYKFYRQAGNPNKWIKQYNHDMKKKCCINISKK